jgi:hypothetical protein
MSRLVYAARCIMMRSLGATPRTLALSSCLHLSICLRLAKCWVAVLIRTRWRCWTLSWGRLLHWPRAVAVVAVVAAAVGVAAAAAAHVCGCAQPTPPRWVTSQSLCSAHSTLRGPGITDNKEIRLDDDTKKDQKTWRAHARCGEGNIEENMKKHALLTLMQ